MKPRKPDEGKHVFRLFFGMTLIVFFTTGVILGVDGIVLMWDLINPF